MQEPKLRANLGADDVDSTSFRQVAAPPVLRIVHAHELPQQTFYTQYGKRAIDLAIAIPLLVLLILPMLCIAMAIGVGSPGHPLFRQQRVGLAGRQFTIFKFRTMIPDSDFVLFRDQDGHFTHKIRNDPRVTGIGRILRKTSLDELPQLINVVRGDMSLVGPRPELPQIVAKYDPWQHERHFVRPGITGWWQVSGRSNRPMHECTELDIYYVQNISPRMDAQVIGRTMKVVLRCVGAF